MSGVGLCGDIFSTITALNIALRERVLRVIRTAELLVEVPRAAWNVQVPTGPVQDGEDWDVRRELIGVVPNYEYTTGNPQWRWNFMTCPLAALEIS